MTKTYQAAICTALTGPDALEIKDIPQKDVKAHQVRIKIYAAGVNYPDLLLTKGEYQLRLEPPFTPGMEVAGEIIEIGEEVNAISVGDKVIASTRAGGFAQETVVDAAEILPLPEGFSYQQGASFFVAARTSHHALIQRGGLHEGECVLVLGATGGVGLAAVQIACALGAKVIAVGSGDEKLAVAKAVGAHHVLDYRSNDLLANIKAIAPRGVDMVYDPVGGTLAKTALRSLGWHGRYLIIGFASGEIPNFAANYALIKGHAIMGVRAGEAARRDPKSLQDSTQDLLKLAQGGKLTPHVCGTYPLSQVGDALRLLEDRGVIGRVVITPNGDGA